MNAVATLLGDKLNFTKEDSGPRGYMIPPLDEARAAWDKAMFPVDWPQCDGWQSDREVEAF
jgi:hypothetical protein